MTEVSISSNCAPKFNFIFQPDRQTADRQTNVILPYRFWTFSFRIYVTKLYELFDMSNMKVPCTNLPSICIPFSLSLHDDGCGEKYFTWFPSFLHSFTGPSLIPSLVHSFIHSSLSLFLLAHYRLSWKCKKCKLYCNTGANKVDAVVAVVPVVVVVVVAVVFSVFSVCLIVYERERPETSQRGYLSHFSKYFI